MDDTLSLEQGNFLLPKALRLAHDNLRAQLVMMIIGGGPIMVAAKRLAELCLPHFEWEEKNILPLLTLLPDLLLGKLRPEMARVMPLLEEFNMRQAEFDSDHVLILSAIELLGRVAVRMQNADCIELARTMRIHESVEEKVVFPMVMSIGTHLRAIDENQTSSGLAPDER
jgi:hypothetical protein